jgi:hypothetical protein
MRDPTRDSARAHERVAAQALPTSMTVGPTLISLVADQVRREFDDKTRDLFVRRQPLQLAIARPQEN